MSTILPPIFVDKDKIKDELIGKGIQYPFSIDNELDIVLRGTKEEKDAIRKINQSIAQIIGTPIGARVMNREFGCNIFTLKFEPLNEKFFSLATYFIAEALYKWEKRIILNKVKYAVATDYDVDNSLVFISVWYTIIKTQIPGNYVFPFYFGTPPVHPQQNTGE